MAARMLWMFFLPAAWSFHVEVNPQDPVYHYGEKLSLNCSVVDCSEPDSLSWTILDDVPLGAEPERRTSPTTTLLVISSVKPMHETSNVYPAQDLRIEWIQGGSVLKTDHGEGSAKAKLQEVSSVYSLPPENNGENITCRATLIVTKDRHEIKETTVALTVLTPPRNDLTTVTPAGDLMERSTSHVSAGPPLQPSLDTPTSFTSKPPPIQLTDPGLYQHVTASTQVQVLEVSPTVPPRKVSIVVSPAEEVKEGDSVSISCVSDGGSDGSVELHIVREGQETPLQASLDTPTSLTYKLPSVQLSDSGLYWCVAANQAGNQTASAQVRVFAPPRDITVTSHPSWSVREGQNVTITCSTLSFPKAITTLKKLDNGSELRSQDGTFHLILVQLSDAGRYQITVSNELGFQTEERELSVMGSSTSPPETLDLKKVIIPTLGTGTMLAAAAMIIRYLRKSKGSDAYSLAMNALPVV
ncbi:hypothetical protein MATL_G00237410 [Megalops atlanticus]|uniref:Ig-like domain-containing protein n=1 Tax=Megalops atlanticus TaxID=7932 RepID=A0A9D3PG30_MEGAT|nr:hypothetical protein MATL_G00237410 [Megalops atlanticus]